MYIHLNGSTIAFNLVKKSYAYLGKLMQHSHRNQQILLEFHLNGYDNHLIGTFLNEKFSFV